MITNIEDTIIQSLITNEEYFSKVFTHLKESHFEKIENSEVFKQIQQYYNDFQDPPKPKEIGLRLKNIKSETLRLSVIEHFKVMIKETKATNLPFMISETEKYVQKSEFTKAIMQGADTILKNGDLVPIYGMMGEALKINFESDYGLDYTNLNDRLVYYKLKNFSKSTGVQTLDDMLGGGFRPKTLNLVGAPPHVGKSVALADFASYNTLQKEDGLFYTLEMSAYETSKRIDANILDIDINSFAETSNETFIDKFKSIENNLGKLIVKEFAPGILNTLKIESHLDELLMEQNFKPKFIYIDYIGLMSSTRMSSISAAGGSFNYFKSVAEEVRAIAVKYEITVISAVQLNRSASGVQDVGIEGIAESFGYAMVADTMFFLYKNPDLDAQGHLMINFVKNRNTGKLGQVMIGVDYSKMRYYDININNVFTVHTEPSVGVIPKSLDFGLDSMSMFS